MKKFFNVVFIIAIISLTLTSCVAEKPKQDLFEVIKERNKIVAGVKFDSKPFGFMDKNGELQGIDVELAREIAGRLLGSRDAVEFKPVTASNRIFSLTSGDIDLVAATMTINEKRKNVIDFSEPYYVAGQAIMVNKNSSISNVKDLNGKKVSIVIGSTSEKNIRLLAPDAIIKGYKTYTDAFEVMKSKQADALTTDDTIIAGFLYDYPNFKMLKARYTSELYGIGFRKGEDTQAFQRAVAIALEEIKADGTLTRIIRKWMTENPKIRH